MPNTGPLSKPLGQQLDWRRPHQGLEALGRTLGRTLARAWSRACLVRKLSYNPGPRPLLTPEIARLRRIAGEQEILRFDQRRALLQRIVARVVAGQAAPLDQAMAWTKFLQDRLGHPPLVPLLDNGQAVYDPIWLLRYGQAHCGQANRVLIDGLETLGIAGRLVQVRGHTIAEAKIDGGWVALDANALSDGQFYRDRSGKLLSVAALWRDPSLLQGLKIGQKAEAQMIVGINDDMSGSASALWFSQPLTYYTKTAPTSELDNVYYGWNYYTTTGPEDDD